LRNTDFASAVVVVVFSQLWTLSSASWCYGRLLSYFVNGHVLAVWFMVCIHRQLMGHNPIRVGLQDTGLVLSW